MMRQFRIKCVVSIVVLASISGIAQTSLTRTRSDSCLDEKLERYFSQKEIRAKHIVNNDLDPGPAKASADTIHMGGVVIEWMAVPREKPEVDITIKINGHQIKLRDQKPINFADEGRAIGPELVDTWDQIRLYNLGSDRKIVAITLQPGMCTGLMCGVSAQLYFDLSSKQTTFFGTYRTDGEAKLYSFGQDGGVAFVVASNFSGDPHGTISAATVTYEPYRLESNGIFVRENYFIKHIQQPERSKKGNSIEDRWMERIRLDQ